MRHFEAVSLRLLVPVLVAGVTATAGAVQAQSGDIPPSTDTSSIQRRDTGIDSSGNHRREVQACLSGRTQQSKQACLEEARNAHAAMRRGELAQPGEDYTANALARCAPLSGEYQAACEARVMGYGASSGGVAGGGVLRQVETVVIPSGQDRVRLEPRTPDPVLLFPAPAR